jgi:hypothetical protein
MFEVLQLLHAGESSTRKDFCACAHMFSIADNKSMFLKYSDLIYTSFTSFRS